ncbi:hypothetical protein OF83DRAFT_1123529 [Amylostereum chailletii]|nr:hypothetical protein OF83DRAFT_1123529 [Amylostereum chailletii]
MSLPVPIKAYVITNVATGTVLTLSNQEWYFEEKEGGVVILTKHQVKYLAVKGTPKSSAEIIAEDTHSPRVFSAQPGSTAGTFQILIKGTHFVLDLSHSDAAAGTPVIAYNNNKTNNQLWKAAAVENK